MEDFREQLVILISTPIYVLIIGAEILISSYQKRGLYTWKNILANVYLMLTNMGIDVLFRIFYLAVYIFFYNHRLFQIENVWLYWVLLFIAEDFLYYWLHRFDHEVRFFWATHVTHHSSDLMNFTVGFRSSVLQPLYRFVYFFPLAWLGFHPLDILFVYAATQIWGILVHTELIGKMGVLEHILVTPSHHRVHHASNAKYLDRNMGMFLIIWDKWFGTFQAELPAEKYEPIRYGLTSPLKDINAGNIIFHEWLAIWSDVKRPDIDGKARWKYIFGPPGYSHDGSRKTSEQMRKEESLKT